MYNNFNQPILNDLYSREAKSVKWSTLFINNSLTSYDLPETPGVYMYLGRKMTNGNYSVIYAGQSNNLRRRFVEHRNDLDRRIINAPFFIYSNEFNQIKRNFTEKALIKFYNPPSNKLLKRTL